MPSKPVFLGARLASLPMRAQEKSVSSEDGMDCVLAEFDDDTGLIQVWILLLEQLTGVVSNCPREHQPPTLELLFELLRELTNLPGEKRYLDATGQVRFYTIYWSLVLHGLGDYLLKVT